LLRLAKHRPSPASHKPTATTARPSFGLNARPPCRTPCPTPSHLIGTTRSGNPLPPPCCKRDATVKPSNNSSARSPARQPTAGRTTDSPNSIRHAATPLPRARLRPTCPELGSVITSCCRFPIFENSAARVVTRHIVRSRLPARAADAQLRL